MERAVEGAARPQERRTKGKWKAVLEVRQVEPDPSCEEGWHRFWETVILPIAKSTSSDSEC